MIATIIKCCKSSNFILKLIKLAAMKQTLLICFVSLAAFSSCSTAYKSGQTPDDVYYSPLPKQAEYTRNDEDNNNRYNEEYYDDRYLRMKVRNRYQWNNLHDWYAYERWGFGHNYYWGSYYNPYNSWNYYYNPYCQANNALDFGNPKLVNYTKPTAKPRVFNVGTYTNTTFNNPNNGTAQNGKTTSKQVSTRPVYNQSNTQNTRTQNESGVSRAVRTIFSGNDQQNNRTYRGSTESSSNRTQTSSDNKNSAGSGSSNSNSSSSGGSSGGSVSRPTRN
jgi:uncharacterized membrane protein YgcG